MSKSLTGTDSSPSMSLEEARAVMWLRNNHRSLGELLDEGYLNKTRLEWAAQKAYDPRPRQAAAVLLDWLRKTTPAEKRTPMPIAEPLPAVDVGITIEQARATLWPFGAFRGQAMGELVDTKQLTLRDLGYAIENAWNERVRQAAIVLSSLRLNQAVKEPPPPAGPLKLTLPIAEARGFWRSDSLSQALPPAQEQGYNIHES